MKKIGIITIHNANNFGSVLQAYATQRLFELAGAETLIIDYRCPKIEQEYGIASIKNQNGIKGRGKAIVKTLIQIKSAKRFRQFKESFYRLIKFEEVDEAAFNAFVVGSDQVWNYKITGTDTRFLLDFVSESKKKYSFSSCFGVESMPAAVEEMYSMYLNLFNRHFVRDKNSKQILEKLIDKANVTIDEILDPTMLLPMGEWHSFLHKKVNSNQKAHAKYILVYQIAHSPSLVDFVEKLAHETGYKIISLKGSLLQRFDAKYVWDVGPIEFLSYIYHAEYIVTNSFHGTVFSILFQKKFYTGLLPIALQHVNSRLKNLLDTLQLNDRLIENINWTDINIYPDFTVANEVIEDERKKTAGIISKILNNE